MAGTLGSLESPNGSAAEWKFVLWVYVKTTITDGGKLSWIFTLTMELG